MRFAIFSDLHDNGPALTRVLRDAERQQADAWICLGDVGHNPTLYRELQGRCSRCTFGNWEVSGLRRLPADVATWVRDWPARLPLGQVVCCHATPDMPEEATTTAAAARYMAGGVGWSQLFPRLHRDEEARWRAFAALEEGGWCAAFHGHTHIQLAWIWERNGRQRLRSIAGPAELTLDAQGPTRYLIGVGSAGRPQDGPQLRYALYDDESGLVLLRSL